MTKCYIASILADLAMGLIICTACTRGIPMTSRIGALGSESTEDLHELQTLKPLPHSEEWVPLMHSPDHKQLIQGQIQCGYEKGTVHMFVTNHSQDRVYLRSLIDGVTQLDPVDAGCTCVRYLHSGFSKHSQVNALAKLSPWEDDPTKGQETVRFDHELKSIPHSRKSEDWVPVMHDPKYDKLVKVQIYHGYEKGTGHLRVDNQSQDKVYLRSDIDGVTQLNPVPAGCRTEVRYVRSGFSKHSQVSALAKLSPWEDDPTKGAGAVRIDPELKSLPHAPSFNDWVPLMQDLDYNKSVKGQIRHGEEKGSTGFFLLNNGKLTHRVKIRQEDGKGTGKLLVHNDSQKKVYLKSVIDGITQFDPVTAGSDQSIERYVRSGFSKHSHVSALAQLSPWEDDPTKGAGKGRLDHEHSTGSSSVPHGGHNANTNSEHVQSTNSASEDELDDDTVMAATMFAIRFWPH